MIVVDFTECVDITSDSKHRQPDPQQWQVKTEEEGSVKAKIQGEFKNSSSFELEKSFLQARLELATSAFLLLIDSY